MLCISNTFKSSLVFKSDKTESVYAKIPQVGKNPILVGCSYRPCNASLDYAKQVCQEIAELKSQLKNSIFLLGGDFNLPDINWSDDTIDGNRYLKAINTTYLDTLLDLGLTQVVKTTTRGASTLDLFLTTHPHLVKSTCIDAGISDHDFVTVETDLQVRRLKPTKRKVLLWNRADPELLREQAKKLNALFVSEYNSGTDVDSMWTCLKTRLLELMTVHIPSKLTSSKVHQPWITTVTKRLLRRKRFLYKKFKNTLSPRNKDIYSNIKRECQRECRRAYSGYVENLINEEANNKKFWTYIKNKRTDNVGIADLTSGNKILHKPIDKANLLNDQFSSVFSKPISPPLVQPPPRNRASNLRRA